MTQPDLAGPCRESWTVLDEFWTCPLPVGSEAVTGVAIEMATDVLWALSGRQFGLCTKLLRPCRRECYDTFSPLYDSGYGTLPTIGDQSWPFPALIAGQWYNLACGSCGGTCSCSVIHEATLPSNLHDVVEVKVDGVALVAGTDYRVDNNRLLVRLGGDDWPICNDLNLDDDQPGTWSVEVTVGRPLPPLGRAALGALTLEFIKSLLCDSTCALPKPVQSISRQGVNMTFLDPQQVFTNGQTGLYVPDLFIQSVNPRRLARRAQVYNLDGPVRLTNVPNVSP